MQVARPKSSPRSMSPLVVLVAIVAAIAGVSVLLGASLPTLTAAANAGARGQFYNMNVPDRAFVFQANTRSITNGRLRLREAGSDAALDAVYRTGDGLNIVKIDPLTGQGTIVYHITIAELEGARTQAISSGASVLIVPTAFLAGQPANVTPAPTTAPNTRLRQTPVPAPTALPDFNPRLYALPGGDCAIETSFVNGEAVTFTFIC